MDNKLAVIAYCPPPHYGNTVSFLTNLSNFPTKNRIILYSDHPWQFCGQPMIKVRPADDFRDMKYPNGLPNRWSVNNMIFFTALRIAISQELDWFLYVEEDCRVGYPGWDQVVFDEFLARPHDPVYGGTMACYNTCNTTQDVIRAWQDMIAGNIKRNFPIPTYSGGGMNDKLPQCVLVNGALGIYSVSWLKELFGPELDNCMQLSAAVPAWDFEIGLRTWNRIGIESFKRIAHLNTIYSGYGEVVTSEKERQQLLIDQKVVAIHQIKSSWTGPDPKVTRVTTEEPKADPTLAIIDQTPSMVSIENLPDVGSGPRFSAPNSPGFAPAVSIMIVSYRMDAGWAAMCLQSIKKFATGFKETVVVIPEKDQNVFAGMCNSYGVRLVTFNEAQPPYGHLHHQVMKCSADSICWESSYVLHMDSDCVFTEPVTPLDYFAEDKPIQWIESFEVFKRFDQLCYGWKEKVDKALGRDVEFETMRRMPFLYPRWLYAALQSHIVTVHRMTFVEYVMKQQPTHQYGFTEFNTLGNFAYLYYPDTQFWVDITNVKHRPRGKVKQYNSRSGITVEIRKELTTLLS